MPTPDEIPTGRNPHKPKPGDIARVVMEGRVEGVHGDSVKLDCLSIYIHRDYVLITRYAEE
jgi:hypothetical protein